MSPNGRNRATNVKAPNNLYTVILALAFGVVLATAAFVAYKSYTEHGAVFKVPQRTVSRFRSF